MAFQEGYLTSGGFRVHYVEWGNKGSAIVLIHSMGMDGHSMDQLCEVLQKNHRILSLTILGHGDSEVPASPTPLPEHAEIMRSCVKQLGYTPYILVGHSIGGMMGMILAAEHPKEVKGLILIDIAPFDFNAPRTGRVTRPPPPERMTLAEAKTYLKERFPGFTPYYVENRIKYAFQSDRGVLKIKPTGDSIRSGMNLDLWPYVERIKIPTLLLVGGEGSVVSSEAYERMKKTVPGIETATIPGTGHMIPQDKPEEFEKYILNFIKKIM
jgi:esterase